MSPKLWLILIIIIFLLMNIVVYPKYDTLIFAAPVWLWINVLACIAIFILNLSFSKKWFLDQEENDE